MKKIKWLMLLVCGLVSCFGSEQKDVSHANKQVADIHNARNSLDYQGIYSGTIPSDDLKTLNISITLTEQEYILRITPLQENARTVTRKGEYTWDENGHVITLKGVKDIIARYFVGENQLRQLDANGKQHTEKDAANYILRKQWK